MKHGVWKKIAITTLLSMALVLPSAALTLRKTTTAQAATDLTVTTPTGYTSANDVDYVYSSNDWIANWGAREEDCVFLTTLAVEYYVGNYAYDVLSSYSGGSSQSNAPSSTLYSKLQSMMQSKHSYQTSYSATTDMYRYTDCLRNDTVHISSFYSGTQLSGTWDSGKTWNREHTWPNSKGLEGNDENDIMMLRPTSVSENSSRGNAAYGESGSYFDPGVNLRGDVARIMLYVYVRWGNTQYMWGTSGVMENLTVLLNWMQADPVDTWEMGRNDSVQSITGVRNVFVDYPELAWQLFGRTAPAITTPSGIASGGSGGGSQQGGNSSSSSSSSSSNSSSVNSSSEGTSSEVDSPDGHTLTIEAKNLSYADSIYILYAVSANGFAQQAANAQMLFWTEPQTEYTYGTQAYTAYGQGWKTVGGKQCQVFYSNGLAAKNMITDVYARAYLEIDGDEYYSQTMKYSVLEYVYEQREKGGLSEEQQTMYTNMLHYGAMAQTLLEYETDRLANATYYKVQATNGTFADGFNWGRYKKGETVTLTANPAQDGSVFNNWTNENGEIIGTSETLTVSVSGAAQYTANYKPIPVEQQEIVFEFGENGTASHKDGTTIGASTSYTQDGYILNITGATGVYGGAYDAMGNSALKIGVGGSAGSFSFTVPDDVQSVVIKVAQYKANTTKIKVNDTAYTITTPSTSGQYTDVTVDTSTNKTISFTTASGGYRCMINSISFFVNAQAGGDDSSSDDSSVETPDGPSQGGDSSSNDSSTEVETPIEIASLDLNIVSMNMPNQTPYSTTEKSTTVDGISISYVQIGSYGNGLQWRTNGGVSGSLWNTTAIKGKITKIVMTYASSKAIASGKAYKVAFGTTANNLSDEQSVSTTSENTLTITPNGTAYFFKITHSNGNTQYWDSIEIFYETGGAGSNLDDLQVHFLELGNSSTGDCTLIKTGNTEILIDAGSKKSSAETLKAYINEYCTDGVLEYVIATHAHEDHIAGLVGNNNAGILYSYDVGTIIQFPKTNSTSQIYSDYVSAVAYAQSQGTTVYTALECWNNANGAKRSYTLGENGTISLNILYNYYYENTATSENDYSVCVLLSQADNNYLFTGDLESTGEGYLVQYNNLPKCTLYKAGHHGSQTSSSQALLAVIQPEIVCVCCCCGSDEYTDNVENMFPTQAFVDRVAPYTNQVYVTTMVADTADGYQSMNGNIVVSTINGEVTVSCSNNNTVFKDTEWFAENRTMPNAWKSSGS